MSVRDNGAGLPAGLDFAVSTPSLGMTIVSLLTRQSGGTLQVSRLAGTSFALQFPAA